MYTSTQKSIYLEIIVCTLILGPTFPSALDFFPPDFFCWIRDGSPPAQVAQNLQLPFIFAYLGSEKLSERRLELERVQEKVPWIRNGEVGSWWVGFHRILLAGVVGDSPISSPNVS